MSTHCVTNRMCNACLARTGVVWLFVLAEQRHVQGSPEQGQDWVRFEVFVVPLSVSYMGTKRKIATRVARAIDLAAHGPLLDLFSGMCAVSSVVSTSRQVWCNDVQVFASSVAKAFFASPDLTIEYDYAARHARTPFLKNAGFLQERFAGELSHEQRALASGDLQEVRGLEAAMPNVALNKALERERSILTACRYDRPYRLFSITFSGGYFGLEQCIQIDSIRFAIDQMLEKGESDEHSHRWMCLALCQAASKVATTTGHFAQHMRVNERNRTRFLAQRRRSVWREWLQALFEASPIGTRKWRFRNRVFCQDAIELLDFLKHDDERPAVVYADPPYTKDQYSRYYHLYETLMKYDYPASRGSGRYRPDRFTSPYSMKSKVGDAMQRLVAGCAGLGATLVLSYPNRGILPRSEEVIDSLIRKYYGQPPKMDAIESSHSSLGSSKGRSSHQVKELIYVAH